MQLFMSIKTSTYKCKIRYNELKILLHARFVKVNFETLYISFYFDMINNEFYNSIICKIKEFEITLYMK